MQVVVDDRLLIEELLIGLGRRNAEINTTSYWYYRACRAAVVGAVGHLSGPFLELPKAEQKRAISSMLRLPDKIGLPEPRFIVPIMVSVANRHPSLNVLNLEAVATAHLLGAVVWLSPKGVDGVLPSVLDAEGVNWEKVAPS